MKKVLLFLALVMMGAMWSSVDARWNIGDRKTAADIKPGDTIVIEQSSRASYLGYYIQATNTSKGVELHEGTGVDNAAVIVVEEGPLDVRTAAPTVYLRLLATNKYLGTSTNWTNGCGVQSDPAKAANFQILSCSEDIPWSNTVAWEGNERRPGLEEGEEVSNWRTNTNAGGRGSDENSVGFSFSPDEKTFKYLSFWYSTEPAVILWNYTDTNQWNVYQVSYEKSLQDDLANLIDIYTSASQAEFIGGTDPGYYDEAKVEAYTTALEEALVASINPTLTDEQYQEAIDNLKAAHEAVENSLVGIEEGYYFIVNGFADFLDKFGVEKAAYIDPVVPNLKYKTFDDTDVDFVFYITKSTEADEYMVQSYANNLYVTKGTQWYNSNPQASIDAEEPQNIRLYTTGLWFWGSHTYHSTSYTPYASNSPTAADGAGNLTTWGVWTDPISTDYHANLWNFRKVSDEQMDVFVQKKAQADLDALLKEKATEASELYNKLFTFITDFDNPLITTVSGGHGVEPSEGNQITFSTIRRQGIAGADMYEHLIDGDSVTYMQGSGYIAIKLPEPKQHLTFVYKTRGGSDKQRQWGFEERPKLVNLYGANTLEGDTVYGEAVIKDMDMSEIAPHTVNLGRPVNRVAYQVTLNYNGGTYFTLSEFQVYEAKADEANSQYYTTEGLKEVADAMFALSAQKLAISAAGTTTEADVTELQEAINAVKALYADTTELVNLIAQAQNYIDNTEIGDGLGQITDAEQITALEGAMEAARELGLKEDATKNELTTAINNLSEAINTFLANIKNIEEGKWYFITSAHKADESTLNGKALYMSGNNSDSPAKVGKIKEGNPEYTYDPYSMWRFIAAEEGGYYVQNMGTGFYLPAGGAKATAVGQNYTRTSAYAVDYTGNSAFTLKPMTNNSRNFVVGTTIPEDDKAVNAIFIDADATTTWALTEIDPEATEFITIKDFKMNAMDIMALPYDYSGVADLNDGCHVYGIKKMTYDAETDETTVEFYEKDEVAANEPAFFYFGNVENDYEEFELLLPFPTEVTDQLVPENGLYGMLHSETIEEGVGYASGKGLVVASEGGTGISAHTGAINPKYYTGEVADVETALTLTVKGMVWPEPDPSTPGDVNEDGSVNAADVVAIYNYITDGAESGISEALADVNTDGTVSAADVVAIYSIISGEGAKSKGFVEAIVEDGDNQVARLSAAIGNSDDLTAVPVTVFLNNSIDIVAAEYVVVAPVAPAKFVYDEEEEDYMIANTDRWSKGHNAVMIAGTALHGQDGFFVSITDSKNRAFAGTEGSIATVYFDATGLADGDYEVTVKDGIAVTKATDTYKTADMTLKFVIAGGKATGLSTITAEQIAAAKSITTIDGQAVATPVKGNIYVVDGAVVKY